MGTIQPLCAGSNAQDNSIQWFVFHGPKFSKRYRWSEWARTTVDQLKALGCWVFWTEGDEIHTKHRCLMVN